MTDVKSNLKAFEEKADNLRKSAADSLAAAAESVRTAGNDSAGTIHNIADEAGRKLDSAATFARTTCVKAKILSGLRNSVVRNPMSSLAVATALGVVAGFSCRSSR